MTWWMLTAVRSAAVGLRRSVRATWRRPQVSVQSAAVVVRADRWWLVGLMELPPKMTWRMLPSGWSAASSRFSKTGARLGSGHGHQPSRWWRWRGRIAGGSLGSLELLPKMTWRMLPSGWSAASSRFSKTGARLGSGRGHQPGRGHLVLCGAGGVFVGRGGVGERTGAAPDIVE